MAAKTYRLTRICWQNMKQRCTNPKLPTFYRYGGRGITVCERWMSFDNFLEDMGEKPAGLSLDRINNDLGYCKENCRWADSATQSRNTQRQQKQNNGIRYVDGKWFPRISMNGHELGLGGFTSLEDAQAARKKAVTDYVLQKNKVATFSEIRRDNTSGITGVNFHKHSGKWNSRRAVNGKRVSIGFFETKEEAIKALKFFETNKESA